MFYHVKPLQFEARPEKPDPLFARKMQEILGGPFGEISVTMQYLFQGWNCRAPMKYRDMLLDIGTEEISHVEMLATMIGQLLEDAPLAMQEDAVEKNPVLAAVMGGMNPKHAIVSGLGAMPADSVGYPWNARYIVASGNLLADFRANVTAESQGRLQAVRLYEQSDDAGVKKLLGFMIARDTMHQNQWLAAIEELQRDGLADQIAPTFQDKEAHLDAAYQFWNLSEGTESQEGAWAAGTAPDGKGTFTYLADPEPQGQAPDPPPAGDPRLHNTGKESLHQNNQSRTSPL